METIFTNIKERILQITDYKQISKEKFFKDLGVTYGNFKGKAKEKALSSDILAKIVAENSEINPEWLLTGNGEMLKTNKIIASDVKRNLIPLFNDVATIGGANGLAASVNGVSHATEYIDSGDWFPGATAAIRHYGDSMPEYANGSILALKVVEDIRLLVWGRNYCIETSEYRITKKINKSKDNDYLTANSTNKETYLNGSLIHEPIEIPKEAISKLFQVLGSVKKEYSSRIVDIL